MNKEFYFFLPDMKSGGAQKVFLNLLHYLAHNNKKTTLILLNEEGDFLNQLPETTQVLSLVKKNNPVISFPLAFIKLCFFIKKNKPGFVLSSLTGANIMLLLARNLSFTETKIIIREACTLINIKSRFKLFLARLLYKSADGIVAVSEGIKDDLIKQFKLRKNIINVIYNPVNIEQIKRLGEIKITEEYFSRKIKTIIAVGRLIEQKDFMTLVKAFNLVHSSIPVQLIIIGEGEQRAELTKLIHSLGLKQKIHLIGYRENPYQYMKRSDLFVLSSKWEGFPNVIIEALSLDLPIVASDCHSGPREIQQAICNDIQIIPVEDYQSMAIKIKYILTTNYNNKNNNNIEQLNYSKVNQQYIDFINQTK